MNPPTNQQTCPSNTNDQANCNQTPNAVWAGTSSTMGTCNCCLTDGTTFVNTAQTTTGANPCQLCASTAMCGDQNGYCNGSTGQAGVPCIQDGTTFTWSPNCGATTLCGGQCSGSCGIGEWFAFQTCNKDTGNFACTFSWAQYKSWLVYGGILFLLILVFLIIFVF